MNLKILLLLSTSVIVSSCADGWIGAADNKTKHTGKRVSILAHEQLLLADKKTDEVLGVHMIGARVADLIAEAVTAMEFKASAEDISRMSHSHPTYAEAIKEAALAATENRPIHI